MSASKRTLSRARVALLGGVAAIVAAACVAAPAPWTGDTPSGVVDEVTVSGDQLRVRGWASDRNSEAPVDVVVHVDGVLQAGVARADGARPDVASATGRAGRSGFDRTWTVRGVSPSSSVCVTAINVGPGAHGLLGCTNPTRRVTAPAPPTTAPPTTTPPTTAPPATTVPPRDCSAPPAPGVNWENCDLSGRDLSGVDLTGAVMTGANLTGALLSDATLDRVRLDQANLTGVVAERVSAVDASMDDTRIVAADFDDSSFVRVQMEHGELIGSSFTNASWVQVDADFAAILFTDMTGVRIEYSSLRYVVFTSTKLDNANVSFSNFTEAVPFLTEGPGATWFTNTCLDGLPYVSESCLGDNPGGGAPAVPPPS